MRSLQKKLLVVLAVALFGVLLFLVLERMSSRRGQGRSPIPEAVTQPPVSAPPFFRPLTNMQSKASVGSSVPAPIVEASQPLVAFALPMETRYKPPLHMTSREELSPILRAASNAAATVDRILRSKDYNVEEFSRTAWLVTEDKAQSTVWRIFPYKTNAVVGSVEAVVYQDAALTQRDPTRSFQMSFDPETGTLRGFSWADKHEVLLVQTNGAFVDYARHLEGRKKLAMRWDANGAVVSSNVYDWTTRGRIIGEPSQTNRPRFRLGPTSTVETATEAWRRNSE